MAGLLTPPGDVLGAISEFLHSHGFYNVPMAEHEPPVIYLQKLQVVVTLDGDTLIGVKCLADADYDVHFDIMATIDLSDPNSLELLLDSLNARLKSLKGRK